MTFADEFTDSKKRDLERGSRNDKEGTGPVRPDAVNSLIESAHQIWHEKAVGLVYDSYQHSVKIHTALGDAYGRDTLVTEVIQHLAAFPDCAFYDEGAVWDDEHGLYVSHLSTGVAHNTGYSNFGPPTGKRVRYRTATDFLVKGDRIAEVWRVHDGLALAQQLGLGVRQAAEVLKRQRPTLHQPAHGELERLRGQEPPPQTAAGDGLEATVRWAWHEVWNRRRLDRVTQLYAPNYSFLGPSGRRFRARSDFVAFVLELLAAFPDAVVGLERLTCQGNRDDGRAAVRWRLSGTHDGPGPYGVPSGQRVNILGITHQHLRGGEFVKEWTVFDELALLVQLHSHDHPTPEQSALECEPKDWSREVSDVRER